MNLFVPDNRPTWSDDMNPPLLAYLVKRLSEEINLSQNFLKPIIDKLAETHNLDFDDMCEAFAEEEEYDKDDIEQAFTDAYYLQHQWIDRLIKTWVISENITPEFSVGDKVSVMHKMEKVVGEIVEIKHDTANYVVYCESLGHVREGFGTHGFLYPFEEVTKI